MHFHYKAMPQQKNPVPGGHEIKNFGRPFLGHHYTLSLADLWLGVQKKILKEIIKHFHSMTIGYDLAQEPLPLRAINLQFW